KTFSLVPNPGQGWGRIALYKLSEARLIWSSQALSRTRLEANGMSSAIPPRATALAVRAVTTRGVRVPLTFVLGTSAAIVRAVPLLLVDVLMEEGVVGRTYVFCYSTSGAKAIAEHIIEAVELAKGHPAKPQAIFKMLSRRFTLRGVTGPGRMALPPLDVALGDGGGCAAGLPLAELGGAERRSIPAYDSRGLGLMVPKDLAHEAGALLASGLKAIKLRLGYQTLAEDLGALNAVRSSIPNDTLVMVD